ncbi:unnamed protein product [Adineta steineri]|uniref:40S ribosomal protein S7 n=1 Tax=Adineta steineri TaxID=433720 RepID=A0A820HKI1_9BILA|nr:unnamed protein product [Adineta steineri]
MSTNTKIMKSGSEPPTSLELEVSQQFSELEGNAQFKGQLRELYITGAKKIDIGDGRSALVIYIPVPKVKNFQRVHSLLVCEFE